MKFLIAFGATVLLLAGLLGLNLVLDFWKDRHEKSFGIFALVYVIAFVLCMFFFFYLHL